MNTFRNLFPHPHTFFPSRSRQSRSRNQNQTHTPAWRTHRESSESPRYNPGNLIKTPGGCTPHDSPLMTPYVQTNRNQRSQEMGGHSGDFGHDFSADEMDRARRGLSRRRYRGELLGKRRGGSGEEVWGRGEANRFSSMRDGYERAAGISNREWERGREREIEKDVQRIFEGVMDMQEIVFQEQERLEDEWRCIESVWEMLVEGWDLDRNRERERERGERGINGLGGERSGMRGNGSGRGYMRWNEGAWENMGVSSREMG